MHLTDWEATAIRCNLHGTALVWLKETDGSGALAYPHHVEDDGQVNVEGLLNDSFGHVTIDGKIMRYREQIGTVDDLVIEASEGSKT